MADGVIAGEKMEEVKSKTDPVRVMGVAINRGKRFVSAYPFTYRILNGGPKIEGREVKGP